MNLNFFKFNSFQKKQAQLIEKKAALLADQTSPLFRTMWVHDADKPSRRRCSNNMCAFHIGKGLILSVAHNIRMDAQIYLSAPDTFYQTSILPSVTPNLQQLFNICYPLDPTTQKRYYTNTNHINENQIINELVRVGSDTRWLTLNQNKLCQLFLIVQFKTNQFYQNPDLTNLFNANRHFHEPTLNRYTFLIELELVDPSYTNDIAIYRIINTDQRIIDRLPSIRPNFNILDNHVENIGCLQSAPGSNIGRLFNDARIEGLLEQWSEFQDRIEGNYIMEGMRYLIKGYFRFGSSGAPYLIYNNKTEEFEAAAIQSEASPIQLAINGNRSGNFQYVNAIATPLKNMQKEIEQLLT